MLCCSGDGQSRLSRIVCVVTWLCGDGGRLDNGDSEQEESSSSELTSTCVSRLGGVNNAVRSGVVLVQVFARRRVGFKHDTT